LKYLITGGAGFIGSALTWRLTGDGHEVVVLDDLSRGTSRRLAGISEDRLTVHYGDIRDAATVARAMDGCDAVIHMAYVQGTQTFYEKPSLVLDVALHGMFAVLEACRLTGCRDLLLLSSSEAYQVADPVPTPETVKCVIPDTLNSRYSYGGGKLACELMANAARIDGLLDRMVIARPHNIYGPDMGREHVIPEFALRMNTLTRQAYLGVDDAGLIRFPIQGSGMETRSFCYVSDCVDQLTLLLKAGQDGIYHVGTMEEKTIREVAHAVASVYGREIELVPGQLPQGSPTRRLPDTAKIEALGYSPKVPFSEGITQAVGWYRAHG
jgi:nucleoside-diphosphate-sugar epimerase